MEKNSTNTTSQIINQTKDYSILYFAIGSLGFAILLILVFIFVRRIYYKKMQNKNKNSKTSKKTELKSIYDDRFGIIENDGENEQIPDKSMVHEFLEDNNKKQQKDDKNFNYISAKNVFNIEGEESDYYDKRPQKSESQDNEDEIGQLSQDIDKISEDLNKNVLN